MASTINTFPVARFDTVKILFVPDFIPYETEDPCVPTVLIATPLENPLY